MKKSSVLFLAILITIGFVVILYGIFTGVMVNERQKSLVNNSRQLYAPAATYYYGGSNVFTSVPPIQPVPDRTFDFLLSSTTPSPWISVFSDGTGETGGIVGTPPIFSSNNDAAHTGLTADNLTRSVKWNGPGSQFFVVQLTMSASIPVAGFSYQIALFVDDSVYESSVVFANFSQGTKPITSSYTTGIRLNSGSFIDFRLRKVSTSARQRMSIFAANLTLNGTLVV